jgi:hypothetical protein
MPNRPTSPVRGQAQPAIQPSMREHGGRERYRPLRTGLRAEPEGRTVGTHSVGNPIAQGPGVSPNFGECFDATSQLPPPSRTTNSAVRRHWTDGNDVIGVGRWGLGRCTQDGGDERGGTHMAARLGPASSRGTSVER